MSSVFGLISIPTQALYNASKFAVRGFTDALRIELEAQRSTVSCTTVHPGPIKTNIALNGRFAPNLTSGRVDPSAHFHKIAITKPERAARIILAAVERDKRRVLVGPDAKMIDLISRLPAVLHQRVLAVGAGRQLRR